MDTEKERREKKEIRRFCILKLKEGRVFEKC